MKITVYKYRMRPIEGGEWSKVTLQDNGEWDTVEKAQRGLEAKFPGYEIQVKVHSERKHIENRAETKKSSKEIGAAGIASMRARLK